jgi:uncharacterized protein
MTESRDQPEGLKDAIKASQLREVLNQYGEALRARRKGLDKLNVYPVPDGDTGTNMSLTVQSVVAELKSAVADDMGAVAQAMSRGAIMGARGNSGAILAQVLRGVSESVKGKTDLGPGDVADALEKARHSAYDAVLKPVEGTILTVVTAAATAARKSADEGHKLKEQMDHIRLASAEALARTPELLPVLKQAGVVDAGGSGFLLFVDALRYVITGEPIPGIEDEDMDEDGAGAGEVDGGELGDLRYEVMFLLDAQDDAIPAFRQAWSQVGDSIVVVGGDGMWNCHIHSDDIGLSIETALEYGRPQRIRVTDLQEQVGALHGESDSDEPAVTAVVAVVPGHGLAQTYRSFGVQRIVGGGQSSNPSVAELLSAVESAPSDSVIVLPNNKNVHAAAKQLDELTTKSVLVVPTVSPVQGLAAAISFDASQPADVNLEAFEAAASAVVPAEVTQAVRNALTEAGPVKTGNWLGIVSGDIKFVDEDLAALMSHLVANIVTEDHEIVTLVCGEGASEAVTNSVLGWLEENRPSIEVEVHAGGQPLYPYLIGIE